MTIPHSLIQAERLFHVNYFLLFDPKPSVQEETLEAVYSLLYDLRRQIPEIMSIHITDNLKASPGGYRRGCIIGYPDKWKLEALITHPAFLQAQERLQDLCERTASFAAESYLASAPHSIRLSTPLEERRRMTVASRLQLILRDELQLAESHARLDASFIETYEAESIDLLRIYEAIIDEFELPAADVHAELFTSMQDVETWLARRNIT